MASVNVKRGAKPPKPYPEFPLFAHASGVWAKKIRGKLKYFGPWADHDAALERYLKAKDYLYAGQAPPMQQSPATLNELVQRYLAGQLARADAGEITPRHYEDCRRDGKRVLGVLGRHRPAESLKPADFAKLRAAIAAGRKATSACSCVMRTRSIFAWGFSSHLLAVQADYGGQMSRPPARAIRAALNDRGRRTFPAAELRTLLKAAKKHPNLHSMIFLGINAGYGNTDCAELDFAHMRLKEGIVDLPRPKTGVARRAVLWPETVKALRAVLERRAEMTRVPPELADRVFVTRHRLPYVSRNAKGTELDAITTQFRKLMERCGVFKAGLGFYSLRRTCRTIMDETKDFPACDLVMGHIASDVGAPHSVEMADRYRGGISDARMKALADHVRTWLSGPGGSKGRKRRKV
jgi:hypothetical protein